MMLGWALIIGSACVGVPVLTLLLGGNRIVRRRLLRRHRILSWRGRRIQIHDPAFAHYDSCIQRAYWAWNESRFDQLFGLHNHPGHWVITILANGGEPIRFSLIDRDWAAQHIAEWDDRKVCWQQFSPARPEPEVV